MGDDVTRASEPSQAPSESEGTMSDVDYLKQALSSVLAVDESEAEDEKKKCQQGLSEILAKLTSASELQSALDVVLQSSTKDTSPGLLKRVQFFSDIHLIAAKDPKFTAYICNLKLSSFEEIARNIYFTPLITPDVSDEKIQSFRSYLFQNQPTAVLLGLVEGDSIKLTPSAVKTNVVAILSSAINDGFDISRDSTRVLSKQITFPNSVPSKTRNSIVDAIKQIQRLQALVREPEHVGLLTKAEYSSASSIANTELATFQEEMEEQGMAKDVAGRIHDHALTVQIRNEQTWALALSEKNNSLLPKVIVNQVTVKPDLDGTDKGSDVKKKKINLTTLFNDMDTVACTECSSVLSPSAYFVDLLRLLQDTKSTDKANVALATLFDKLMERRPDLQHLKLSCANTSSLVPYLDLVTEILESFIAELSSTGIVGGPKAIQSFDAPSVDADGVCTSQPRNTNYDVYNRVVAKEVFPMETFPYNLSMHTIRELLSATGTSRYDVINTFSSVDRLMSYLKPLGQKQWNAGDAERLRLHFAGMIDRCKAAEYLGLDQEDFMAICRESFQPLELWRARNKESSSVISLDSYRQEMGVPAAAELWGYSSTESVTAKQIMLDEVSGLGLTFIRLQVLDRAAITMQDLQDILNTQFMGRRLIVTTGKVSSEGGKPVFTGALSEMRLRLSLLGSHESSTLTEDVCHDLQAFVRLWKKLQTWSISDLDTVLSTLKRKASKPIDGISPAMIQDLAAVKILADTTKISPYELQVLWGDIDTNGPQSLYARVFLAPRVVRLDRYFEPDAKGNFLKSGQTISQHRPALLSTLEVLEADFQAILSASLVAGSDGTEKSLNGENQLTIANLSILYRSSLVCRVLDIKPDQLDNFRHLFPKLDVFESPRETLAIFEKYKSLCKTGWTIEGIFEAMEMGADPHIEERALAASSRIASAKLEIELKDQTALDDDVRTDAELKRILPLLFDASSALNVSKHFDENPSIREEVVFSTAKTEEVKIPKNLESKLSCINFDEGKKGKITLTGLLSKDELEKAVAILEADSNWTTAINTLYDRSRSIFDLICRQLRIDEAGIKEAENVFLSVDDSASKQKKKFAVKKALPLVNAQLLRQTIMDSVSVAFPIPAAPLTALMGDIIKYTPKASESPISAYEALRSIKLHDASEESFQGFFCPPASGKFQFMVNNGTANEPQLSVNEVKLEFTNVLGIWKSNQLEGRLISGKYYSFSFVGNIEKQISYTTQDSLTPSGLRSDMFVSRKSRDVAVAVYQKLTAACKVVLDENLSLMEVEYCQNSKMIDFNNIAFEGLVRVNSYGQVRTNTAKELSESEYTLAQFLSWASSAGSSHKETLSKLFLATGWPEQQVNSILDYKYPAKLAEDRLKLFGDEIELISISQILTLLKNVNLPTVEALDFFKIATPTEARAVFEKAELAKLKPDTPQSSVAQFSSEINTIAATLRLATSSSVLSSRVSSAVVEANNKLRETQRTVLIQYLLNHKKVKNELDIEDADGLFEYFLIDVKMGAKLQTSRMRQAISTVQLFVQRCNLGLEMVTVPADKTKTPPQKAYETKCSTVSVVRWKYMTKFSLWVAHRKLFLYPENWIDPTIRDNRTEPFKALEGALSQNNLNAETISTAIKSYIYQVNEIADLEVLSYVRQYIDEAKSRFHFFAKTRQGPFQYYYRYADVGSGQLSDIRWAAWTKIDVEIPSIETDIDGNPLQVPGAYVIPLVTRGRLFLYIPQFMAQNRPNKPSEDNFQAMANKSPKEVANTKLWEMKLGWTEYRNGKWTPKQTSQASLKFPDVKAPILPPLHSLRFFVNSASSTGSIDAASHDTIYIDVQSWYQKVGATYRIPEGNVSVNTDLHQESATKQWPLGRFRIRGTQIHAIAADTKDDWAGPSSPKATDFDQVSMKITDNDHSLPTSFSKLWAKSIAKEVNEQKGDQVTKITKYAQQESKPSHYQVGKKEFLLLAYQALLSDVEQDYTWTASFDKTRFDTPSALILQVADRFKIETYFAIPPANDTEHKSSETQLFNHPSMGEIMERSTSYDDVQSVYTFLNTLSDTSIQDKLYGKLDNDYNEQSTPYALYHWELGMHAVSLVMERCAATQQYELALEVAKLVFDPGADANQDKEASRCWQFLPFKNIAATESISDILRNLIPEKAGIPSKTGNKVTEWKNNPFSPHSVARGRPNVYMKRFVLQYIEVLVAAGDEYFRQNSLESIPLAIQRYVEASHLYGPVGKATPKLGKLPVKTFDQLSSYVDAFSNAKVEMELDFPYSCEPCYRGAVDDSRKVNPDVLAPNTYVGLVQTGYFCLPPNPKLMEVRNLIDDRLFKIRNSLDINGNAITLALFDPPLDPGVMAKAQAANLSPSVLLNDLDTPMPNYRFYYLLQKAVEMCSELKVLGDQFLSAKEKRDSETLTMLLTRNEVLSNTTQLSIKGMAKKEAEKSIAALEEARKGSVMRLSFYLALIGESPDKVPEPDAKWTDIPQSIEKPTADDLRMTSYEKKEMEKSDSAADLSEKASVLELTAGALMAIPNLLTNMQPMGVGAAIKMDAENIAKLLQCTATALNLKGQMDTHEAQRAARKGGLIRQLQERRLQANSAGWEIRKIDKDLDVQRVRLALAESEIRAQQQHLERVQEVQEWHRTKYTNASLYSWLENSFRTLYHKTFLLAMQLARKAERSFQFEMASRYGSSNNMSFLAPGGYWDSARDGLLSASNLYLGLKRLEAAYMEKRPHDYEISKNVSLRQIDPAALFSLRQTGTAIFSLSEALFDMDFPGQYFRRIKSVGISIPAVVGPYTGLNCILSLTQHRTRITPMAATASESYEYKGRDDVRFQTDTIPISSIAVSHGTSDSGTFELNFSGERYLPFEGAGCYSKWKLEFPAAHKQFDYNTISDAILHVRYTAVEGGIPMREAANKSVKDYVAAVSGSEAPFVGPTTLLDLKNDFANAWYDLSDGASEVDRLRLTRLGERLPFFTRGRQCKVKRAVAYICMKKSASAGVGITLLEPKGSTFEAPTQQKDQVPEGVEMLVIDKLDWDIEMDWELQVTGKEKIENILLLLQYGVEDGDKMMRSTQGK